MRASLRHFLTPALYKQVHRALGALSVRPSRWKPQPLVLMLLCLTWCAGDSLPERFETARAFCITLAPKRRRPGHTWEGFRKALNRLPVRALRVVAAVMRRHLEQRWGPHWVVEGFVPLGCDGTRLACPRVRELEQRLGRGAQAGSPPWLWLTALVHLTTGVPWAWRLGRADADERRHLRALLGALPARALVVLDAGYQGYEVVRAVVQAGADVLVRVSAQTALYTEHLRPLPRWQDGPVYWWTHEAQRQGWPPLRLRLLRVKGRRRHAVWLVTSVRSPARLSREQAGAFYRQRWENEGFFRSFKHALRKVKLRGRGVRLVHRELEGALLAVQVLLAHGLAAVLTYQRRVAALSVRQLLVAVRRELHGQGSRGGGGRRLARLAVRERRPRRTPKVARAWPSRRPPRPSKPPHLRRLEGVIKQRLEKQLGPSEP